MMDDMTNIRILKVDGIGNVVSIEDAIAVIEDAMNRSTVDSLVWTTYNETAQMFRNISGEYDKLCEAETE